MAFTILPFVSLFTTALQPSGTYPPGLEWPAHPQWGNFVQAFKAAQMGKLLESSALIVAGVVPVSVLMATMAGFAIGHLRMPGGRVVFLVFLVGLTLPFEGVITPLYYEVQGMGLLNTQWAIILPLIGLFMPFSVYWMRAHFVTAPAELTDAALTDGVEHLAALLAHPRAAGQARDLLAHHLAVPVDLESVPAGHRAGR